MPAKRCAPTSFPTATRVEWIADLCVHVVGVGAGLVGGTVLLIVALPHVTAGAAASLSVYAAGLLGMFTLSALYNLARNPARKFVLRQLDQSAIFVMIAGTYTPFAVLKIGGTAGTALMIFVWALALIGLVLKVARPGRADGLSLVLYLAMGWSMIFALEPLFRSVAVPVFVLLVVGGLIYTVGVVFHLWSNLRFHNAIWHGCVLVGAACHYAAVFGSIALPNGFS